MANNTRDLDLFGFFNIELIDRLLDNDESDWLEFKLHNADPEKIGKLCSAISNSATLAGRDKGYIVWGIDNGSRQIVGTRFNPDTTKKGGQDFYFWLTKMLNPRLELKLEKIAHSYGDVVLLEIPAAERVPTAFHGTSYVRIGSNTTNLQEHPQIYERLIGKLRVFRWEKAIARDHLENEQVLELLDWEKYFERMHKRSSTSQEEIFENLKSDKIVRKNDAGKWDITNLGAILFARNLSNFGDSLVRKGIRLTVYRGDDKSSEVRDKIDSRKGYVLDLELIEDRIREYVPVSERINGLIREDKPDFPTRAIRELLVNALVHQDFTITGAGPNIYLFRNALEIENPGESLVPSERMIDLPPISRNDSLSGLMRRLEFCEERDSGLDKVISVVESLNSPPPDFMVANDSTQVIFYGPRIFSEMTRNDRVRACYQHAVIMHLKRKNMTNSTLRTRFGLPNSGRSKISKIIRDSINANLIKPKFPKYPHSGYVPVWA